MISGTCRHPANALLLWYLNGSLASEEEGPVRDHLQVCETCAREMDELSDLVRAIHDRPGAERAAAQPARTATTLRWMALGIAASLAALALLGWYSALLRVPAPARSARERPGMSPAAVIDLGSGPGRGSGEPPVLNVSPSSDTVVISFLVPADSRAGYVAELEGPDGERLARLDQLGAQDPLGRCTLALPASLLTSGTHELVLIERVGAGDSRRYRYPFRIEKQGPAGMHR